MKEKVYIVGHKNPDTDSICSALSYAYLKNQIGEYSYEAKRAGVVSPETQFVLNYFGVEPPELIEDIRAQLKDCSYEEFLGVKEDTPVKECWEILKKTSISSLPVVDENNKVVGIISTGDIAKTYISSIDENLLKNAKTPVVNIAKTLNSKLFSSGNKDIIEGTIKFFNLQDNNLEYGDILVAQEGELANLDNSNIVKNASLIIVYNCNDNKSDLEQWSKDNKVNLVVTAESLFTVNNIIRQSIPVSYLVSKDMTVNKFVETEIISDIKELVADGKYRNYPIVDEDSKLKGVLSRGDLINPSRKKIIMVDHNEIKQGVKGMSEAQIIEILDHHKIGNINTIYPIFYRNRTVGCSCTIIYGLYKENNIEIPKEIAGLMCSAILSDTLLFKSPTCTVLDKIAGEELAKIAGIVPEEYAMEMFSAASDFGSKTTEEIFNLDYKKFQAGDTKYGVAQVSSVSRDELNKIKPDLLEYMTKLQGSDDELDMLFLMLTDILNESTDLVCVGMGATKTAEKAFDASGDEYGMFLEGTVSRKKQIIPKLSEVLM